MKKLYLLIIFCFLFPQSAAATTYYMDCAGGNNAAPGTATTTAFLDLDQFTENARTGGDVLVVRRGKTACDNGTNLTMTSAGSINAPITIIADYDNLWNDFATSSETWNITPGATNITSSASTTTAFPGTWIYFAGDCYERKLATTSTITTPNIPYNQCQYAYEVATANSSGITLMMPYKGPTNSAAATMRVMPANPVWGSTASAISRQISGSGYIIEKGLDYETSTSNALLIAGSSVYEMDMIFKASATGVPINVNAQSDYILRKIRTFSGTVGMKVAGGQSRIYDSLFDCQGTAASIGFQAQGTNANVYMYDSFIRNCINGFQVPAGNNAVSDLIQTRNIQFQNVSSSTNNFQTKTGPNAAPLQSISFEDFNGSVGDNRFVNILGQSAAAKDQFYLTSSTGTVRSGGGPVSIDIKPTTFFSSTTPYATVKLFEYPIYADTTNKNYTVYFSSTSTTAWTSNPLSTELYIDCQYWASVTTTSGTSTRVTNVSSTTVDFAGSTNWQSISVQCKPVVSGIVYLRGWYNKPKENNKMNEFFVDTTPVIN